MARRARPRRPPAPAPPRSAQPRVADSSASSTAARGTAPPIRTPRGRPRGSGPPAPAPRPARRTFRAPAAPGDIRERTAPVRPWGGSRPRRFRPSACCSRRPPGIPGSRRRPGPDSGRVPRAVPVPPASPPAARSGTGGWRPGSRRRSARCPVRRDGAKAARRLPRRPRVVRRWVRSAEAPASPAASWSRPRGSAAVMRTRGSDSPGTMYARAPLDASKKASAGSGGVNADGPSCKLARGQPVVLEDGARAAGEGVVGAAGGRDEGGGDQNREGEQRCAVRRPAASACRSETGAPSRQHRERGVAQRRRGPAVRVPVGDRRSKPTAP